MSRFHVPALAEAPKKKRVAATASVGISTRHENLIDKYPLDSQTCKLQKML